MLRYTRYILRCIVICIQCSFSGMQNVSLPVVSLFSRFPLRGTPGPWLYTTAQMWVLANFHGTCSERSKCEILQVATGSLSAELEPCKRMKNPYISCFAPRSHPRLTLDSRFPCSFSDGQYYSRATTMRVSTFLTWACMLCCYVCVCVRVLTFVCCNHTFQVFCFDLLAAAASAVRS